MPAIRTAKGATQTLYSKGPKRTQFTGKVNMEELVDEHTWPSDGEDEDEDYYKDDDNSDDDNSDNDNSDDGDSNGNDKDPEGPPTPRIVLRKCINLYDNLKNGNIVLDPDYQRGEVWSVAKQRGFIDSILKGWATPPILLSLQEDGAKVCMDGMQRLISIKKFVDGEISIKHTHERTFYSLQHLKKHTQKRSGLADSDKKRFDERHIVVYEFKGMTEAMERETFNRLQLGVVLTSAERIRAIGTGAVSKVQKLTDTYLSGGGSIAKKLAVKTRRAQNFMLVAQVVYMVKSTPDYDQATTNKVEKFLRSGALNTRVGQMTESGFRRLSRLLCSPDNVDEITSIHKGPVAPVEFVHMCLVCALRPEWRDGQLLNLIIAMLTFIRKNHQDVRSNSNLAGSFRKFLESKEFLKSRTMIPSGRLDRGETTKRSLKTKAKMKQSPTTCTVSKEDKYEGAEDSILGASPAEYAEMEGVFVQSDKESVVDGSVYGEMPF
ncbi:hypothetical protein BDV93DRAFT_559964 [Ceratobasidium sp. AG-I]|nr:hypothetical protein BDV93DRAFT_559964 [Ceratobasidium sp. AG-I]